MSKALSESKTESPFSYDYKTKRMKLTKRNTKSSREKGLNYFKNFKRNSMELEKKGISTVNTYKKKLKKEIVKTYTRGNKKSNSQAKKVSNVITSLPKEDLSIPQKKVQSKFKALDTYEKEITKKINNTAVVQNRQYAPKKKKTKIKLQNKELDKLRAEIESLSTESKKLNTKRSSLEKKSYSTASS